VPAISSKISHVAGFRLATLTSTQLHAVVNTNLQKRFYTTKEFTRPFNHKGKLRVRGLFKTMIYAHAMAISINFGRVWRHLGENPDDFALRALAFCILDGLFGRMTENCRNEHWKLNIRDKSCRWPTSRWHVNRAA
jgi:hypothetical protein